MRIRLTIAIVLILLVGPSACVLFSNCDETKPYFLIEGLTTSNLKTGGFYVQPNETVQWDSYTLRVQFEQRFISKARDPMGGAAMAIAPCDPDGYKGTKVGLDTLFVVTEMDYNGIFHQGDTINSMVKVGLINSDLESLEAFMANSKDLTSWGIEIQLTEPPSNQNTISRLKFSMILKDGSKFEATASEVTLMW